MSDNEIKSIHEKLDVMLDLIHKNHTENVRAHAILEGQELDKRLTSIEKKFWPLVGVFSVLGPVGTAVLISWVRS